MKERKKDVLKTALLTMLAVIIMGMILFPVYYMFTVSLRPEGTLVSTSLQLVPQNATLDNYREILFGHKDVTVMTKNFNITADSGKLIGNNYVIEFKDGTIWGNSMITTQFNMKYAQHIEVEGGNKSTAQDQIRYVKGEFVKVSAKKIVSNLGVIGTTYLKAESITIIGNEPPNIPGLKKVGNNTYVANNVNIKLNGRFRLDIGHSTFQSKNFFLTLINKIGGEFFGYLKRSLIIASLTVLLTLLFVVPAAYSFSRMKFFGREHVLYFYLMFTQVSGGLGIAGLIALYGMLVKLGLTNNIYVLPLIYAAGAVPFNTWLLKSYVDSISTDFDEAALVDGASYLQIIRHVIFPMALPGIATVAVFAFIGGWTELIIANLLLNQNNYPLTVWLYSMLNDLRNVSWNQFSAAAMLFALPVFVIFLLAQRFIRSGLTIGGLKE